MYPIPFTNDPVRGKTISLAIGDVKGLDPGQWLSTSLVDYVLQTSLAGKLPDHVLIGSSNCSTYFHTFNSKLRNEDDAIDGILKKMSLRIQAYCKKYERKMGVVETVYPHILDRWEKGVGYGWWTPEAMIKSIPSTDCEGWQMHGVPCVNGMAYFRWRNDWTLQQVVEEFVEKCHTYDFEQKLYSGSFVPVCMDMLQPDQTTLPPDFEGKRMAGRPKTVRLRLRSRYSHQPDKSPIVCSRHQHGHNARTYQRRAALAKNTRNADTAQNSNSVL
ncbi:hypothetical protein IV203_027418 [Nitzschia inconspicua]|uniref:Uncharacterized protein n=1 Tax=Nitzschia inconspicua TaxID=303405 RepID=A0A9K3Q3C4_9STRA|nr:hypothetical protein IV203_027418 [Nitzschia inconspicua]